MLKKKDSNDYKKATKMQEMILKPLEPKHASIILLNIS